MDYFRACLVAFLCTCVVATLLIPFSIRIGWVDRPDPRKTHDGQVPLVGGVAQYIGVLFTAMLFSDMDQSTCLYFISAAILLSMGCLDDKYDLPISIRSITHVLVASIFIFGTGLYLESLGFIFYFFDLHLGQFGILFTIIAVLGAINSFNMVDGLDGLAGSLSVVSFTSIASLLYQNNSPWFLLPMIFSASTCGYLLFNLGSSFNKNIKKIFMGDSGSTVIGLTIVWLLVIGTQGEDPAFTPVTSLYLIAVPLMDMAAIMIRRVKQGQSPFRPDRGHLHHIFQRSGFSSHETLLSIVGIATVFTFFGLMGEYLGVPEALMFAIFLGLFAIYNRILSSK